ncbi:hypothetical protein MTR67_008298 [Solanum verrucosum]|uniref:Secreted protein n=1 Tax=Solanum verrucosum TaxID=315347 RepID=A0AAF0Q1V2_SOLVR|nr:hypothetical protein MTR67_008298 [Solanum verrucosum]
MFAPRHGAAARVLRALMILSVWGKNHRSLKGLEMKNEGEKSEFAGQGVGESRLSEHPTSESKVWPLGDAPTRAPQLQL